MKQYTGQDYQMNLSEEKSLGERKGIEMVTLGREEANILRK